MPSPTDCRAVLSAVLLATICGAAPLAAVAEEPAGGQETFYGRLTARTVAGYYPCPGAAP